MGVLEGKAALVTGGSTGLGLAIAGRFARFYASDEAAFITGTTLLIDGGMTAGYLQREHSPKHGS